MIGLRRLLSRRDAGGPPIEFGQITLNSGRVIGGGGKAGAKPIAVTDSASGSAARA